MRQEVRAGGGRHKKMRVRVLRELSAYAWARNAECARAKRAQHALLCEMLRARQQAVRDVYEFAPRKACQKEMRHAPPA